MWGCILSDGSCVINRSLVQTVVIFITNSLIVDSLRGERRFSCTWHPDLRLLSQLLQSAVLNEFQGLIIVLFCVAAWIGIRIFQATMAEFGIAPPSVYEG